MKTILRASFAVLALLGALVAPGMAWAVNVGYYEMCSGQGMPSLVAPIIAAGHTPVNITVPDAAQLAGIDVFFVTNCNNFTFGSEYTANLAAIEAAVNSAGLVLVLHDRFVEDANNILPGGAGISTVRDFTGSTHVDIQTPTLVTNGPAGTLNNASLDGGCSSNHGYADAATLPPGGLNILSTNIPSRSVLLSYRHGAGSVIYSTIPLDFYLGNNLCNIGDDLNSPYTPNVIHYAVAQLQDGVPELAGLTDITAEATGAAGAVVTFTVTATDPEDGDVDVTCTPAFGSLFPLGMTTVNCSATDSDGNETTGSFTVTVVDTTPPSLSLPADLTREATGPGGAMVSYSASASDIVDGSVPVTCTPPSGSTFPLGLNTVSCHATDAAGNTGSDMFSVTVVDTTPPALTLPDDLTREATGPAGAAVTYSATASDTVDGSVAPVCTPASGAVFPLGATPVNCSATDAAGNNATGGFTVTVRDTTAPALTCPSSITGTFGQTVNLGTPTTSDLVDATPTLANNAPGSFPAGTTTVRWTSTDDAGNQASCEQTVTLRYTFQGFFQPVDNLPAVNTVKNGSTVPVKWRLLDANGAYITDTATVLGIGYVPSACGGPEDAIEELAAATGGTTLRWDGSSQFIYNWKTPALPGKCVRLDVRFNDGTTRSANFKLK